MAARPVPTGLSANARTWEGNPGFRARAEKPKVCTLVFTVFSRDVRVEHEKRDRYQRIIGKLFVDGATRTGQ